MHYLVIIGFVILCLILVFLLALFIKGPTDLLSKYFIFTHQAMHTRPSRFIDPNRASTVLVLGDSLAVGVGSTSPQHTVAGNIFKKTNYNVNTSAVIGYKISNLPDLIPQKTAQYNAVVVILGGNDFALYESYLPNAVVYNMVEQSLRLLRSRFPRPIPIVWATYVHPTVIPTLATNIVKDANLAGWKSGMYFKDVLEKLGPQYAVRVENFKDITYMPSQFMSKDGVHPSDAGYEVMSDYIIRALQ
jgi:lysophospholipase L1-like esterase